jgi:ABC-type oligopeptide transport system substrate-binding subunit
LYLFGWSADYPDPHDWLSLQWKSDALNNNVHYRSKVFDRLVSNGDVTWNVAKRMRFYNAAQRQLVKDAAWIPLFIPHRLVYIRPGVDNLVVTGYGVMPRSGGWSAVRITTVSTSRRLR